MRNYFYINLLRYRDKEEGKQIIQEIEKQSGYTLDDKCEDFASLDGASWYNAVADVKAVAEKHPDAIIELHRKSEDDDTDQEKTRFHGTKTETVTMEIHWPPFKEIVPKKQTHVATVIEVDGNGDVFTTVYTGNDPDAITDSIVNHLRTESSERGLTFTYNRAEIYDAVRCGNDVSGPERIEAIDAGVTFHIATTVV